MSLLQDIIHGVAGLADLPHSPLFPDAFSDVLSRSSGRDPDPFGRRGCVALGFTDFVFFFFVAMFLCYVIK